jgi:hypothetical protein
MTRIEAIDLFKGISQLPKKEYNRFFLYAVEKTKTELKTVIDEAGKKEYEIVFDEKLRQLEKDRVSILEQFSKRDEFNNPIIIDRKYDIPEDKTEELRIKMVELTNKYEDDIKRVESLRTSFSEYLKEEIDVNVIKTSFKTIPETLDSDLFSIVIKLVKESDEEIQSLVG